jgi:ankyrin repeat protein
MKELLEDGCDPNIITNTGETLLIDAIKKSKVNAIKLLLKYDCHTSTRNK